MICLVAVTDPPRPARKDAPADDLANPYRGSSTLWRIHAVSVLLVVPQALVWTFTLVWLMTDRGWSAPSAGAMVTFAQIQTPGRQTALFVIKSKFDGNGIKFILNTHPMHQYLHKILE